MEEVIIKIKDKSNELLEALGFEGEPIVKQNESTIIVNIETDEAPLLIGKRGENLRALEHLLRILVGAELDDRVNIVLDVAGYRDKNTERVKRDAKERACAVVSTGDEYDMPPMSAFDRRIVHVVCKDIADVDTESAGYGRDRRVKIKPKKKA